MIVKKCEEEKKCELDKTKWTYNQKTAKNLMKQRICD